MISFSMQMQYIFNFKYKFSNLIITIENILIQNLHHINKTMKKNII